MASARSKLITIASGVVGGPHSNFPLPVRLGDDADIADLAHRDGRDIRFTSADSLTSYDYELIPNGHLLTPDGAWTWFNRPRAIYVESTNFNRTYFGVVNTGSSGANNALLKVGYYDHDDDSFAVFPLTSGLGERDDHDNPALYFRPSDERFFASYSKHNDTHRRRLISTNSEDISAWGSESTSQPDGAGGKYTYANLCHLSSEGVSGRLYDFYRFQIDATSSSTWRYTTSDDGGDTWSASTELFRSSGHGTNVDPYGVFASNGTDRFDCFFTDKHPNQGNQVLCHFFYNGSFKQSDGTDMGAPPFDFTDATLVHDARAGSDLVWVVDAAVVDAALDGTTPAVLYTVYPDGAEDDVRLYYGRWNGVAWDTQEVVATGTNLIQPADGNFYPGGAAFNHEDPDVIYVPVDVNGVKEIQEWTRSSGGWSKTEDVTSGSAVDNFRPYVPVGGGDNAKVHLLWMGNGPYTHWTDYHTVLRCHPVIDSEFAWAVVRVPELDNGTQIRVHYSDPSAVDGQSPGDVYDANYLAVTNGHVPIRGRLSNVASKGTVNAEFRMLGELWDGNPLGGGMFVNQQYSRTADRFDITANFAGLSELYCEAWCEHDSSGADEHSIFGAWDISEAGILFRVEPADNTLEGFVILQPDTPVGANPFPTLTIAADTPAYVGFGFQQDGQANLYARLNTDESSANVANANNMDAGASPVLRAGNNSGDIALGTDQLKGAVGRVLISNILRSKSWTDTQHALRDGSTLTLVAGPGTGRWTAGDVYHPGFQAGQVGCGV